MRIFDAKTNGDSGNYKAQYSLESNGKIKVNLDQAGVATKTGYTFLGWNTDMDATTAQTGTVTVDPGTTFYAIFKKEVSATFHYYDSSGNTTSKVVIGTVYNNATNVTYATPTAVNGSFSENGKTYTLAGWNARPDVPTPQYSTSDNINCSANSLTLYAVYTTDLTLSFDTKGGSTVSSMTKNARVSYNKLAETLVFDISGVQPTKVGYVFAAWEDSDGTRYATGNTYQTAADATLTAIWAEGKTVNVFASNNKHGTVTGGGSYALDDQVTVTATPKEGYQFVVWVENNREVSNAANYTFTIKGNHLLFAGFSPIRYGIVYKLNGGAFDGTYESEYSYGVAMILPTNLSKTGYTFAGWYTQENCTGDAITKIAADTMGRMTFYAKWVINTYSVEFDTADKSTAPDAQNIEYGSTVTKPTDPTTEGYTFDGWYADADFTTAWNFADDTVAANTTLYAKWTPKIYTITWVNEDDTELEKDEAVPYDSMPSYNGTPTKAGDAQYSYTFAGWIPEVSTVKGDAAYKATYTASINKYTVTWLNADGSVLETDNNVSYGTTPEYNGQTPTKAADAQYSYTFNDWDKAISTVTGDVIYTATYHQTVNTYTVTFDVQGHGAAPADQIVAYNGTVSDPGNMTARGYTFGGWFTDPDCTAQWDFATDTITADTTLYAKWTLLTYDVTLPTDQGYTVDFSGSTTVGYDGSFHFTVVIGSGYNSSGMVVKANGVVLVPDENGVYTVPNIVSPQDIVIEGVYPMIPVQYRLDNFATTTGEFKDVAYFGRAAKAGDIVTLKVSLSELGEQYGLDYRKIRVEYETQGAVLVRSNFDYSGNPIYKDGIASEFMLSEGFNKVVAKVYYNGSYVGAFAPFYCNI